ncbi:MAG: hypothetical protein ACE5DW_02350 [Thermodesulfobacteriota bacterium]
MKIAVFAPLTSLQLFIFTALMSFSLPALGAGDPLDQDSMRCLNCHESALVGDLVCHKGGCDHPIGVDYGRAASLNRTLVPPAMLKPGLRLSNGRIGCLTCHIAFKKKDHLAISLQRFEIFKATGTDPMLSVDNNASGLCRSCHMK